MLQTHVSPLPQGERAHQRALSDLQIAALLWWTLLRLFRRNALGDVAIGRPRQAEVLAQGAALVLGAEQPAALQFRHHLFGEIDEAVREASGVRMLKPSAAPVLCQCSSESAMSVAVPQTVRCARAPAIRMVELADGQPLAPRHLDDDLLPALLRVGQRHVGQRPVERIRTTGRSRASRTAYATPSSGWISDCSPLVLVLGLGLAPADHRQHARHDQDRIRRPAVARARGSSGPCRTRAPSRCPARPRTPPRRYCAASVAAGLGLAGMHDHRPALRRAAHHQRPAHLEVLALVIEHVQLVRIEEQPRLPCPARRRRPRRCPTGRASPATNSVARS